MADSMVFRSLVLSRLTPAVIVRILNRCFVATGFAWGATKLESRLKAADVLPMDAARTVSSRPVVINLRIDGSLQIHQPDVTSNLRVFVSHLRPERRPGGIANVSIWLGVAGQL